jgi:transcriptional regulator with XRE-family HTH domain
MDAFADRSAEAAEPGPGSTDEVRLRDVIGRTLRDERLAQGRSLAEVAEEAAVSLPYLSEVERGRKEVSSDVLHAIHTALGLTLDEVLERAGRRLRSEAVAVLPPLALAARGPGRSRRSGPVAVARRSPAVGPVANLSRRAA